MNWAQRTVCVPANERMVWRCMGAWLGWGRNKGLRMVTGMGGASGGAKRIVCMGGVCLRWVKCRAHMCGGGG